MAHRRKSEAPILVVEDSQDDFAAVQRALGELISNRLDRRGTVDEAKEYLEGTGSAPWPRPSLILLDLNLPGQSGLELLRELKRNPTWLTLPVVVLTTSINPSDLIACYRAGANSLLNKPLDFATFKLQMKSLAEYWFTTAVLPDAHFAW
jgi:CheY-like chemotaxis protein